MPAIHSSLQSTIQLLKPYKANAEATILSAACNTSAFDATFLQPGHPDEERGTSSLWEIYPCYISTCLLPDKYSDFGLRYCCKLVCLVGSAEVFDRACREYVEEQWQALTTTEHLAESTTARRSRPETVRKASAPEQASPRRLSFSGQGSTTWQ